MSEPILDVTAEATEAPLTVEISKGPKMLGNKELEEYSRLTGVKVVKLKEIKKKAILGELIEKLGAAQYGTAILFESPEMITDALKQCDEMIETYRGEPEVAAGLMKAKVALIDLQVKAGQALIKSKKDAAVGPEVTQLRPSFPAGIAIQVNTVAKPDTQQ